MKRLYWISLSLLLVLICSALSAHGAASDNDGEVEDEEEDKSSSKSTPAEKPKEIYKPPSTPRSALIAETFDGSVSDVFSRWIKSKAKRSGGDRYDGVWGIEQPSDVALQGDQALIIKTKAKHHAIATKLSSPFDFSNTKQLVVQYEVKFSAGMDCGGAYMKLLSKLDSPEKFQDKSPFTIMFGPDKCGNDQKLHFIVRFRNPKSGKMEEKHMKKPDSFDLAKLVGDKKTHLFTLILNGDSSFEIFVDQKRVKSGSLLIHTDFDPPLVPPAEIDDPKDKKPKDWDDRAKIPDPEATKPDDWDESEPEFIIDPDSSKPSDWLESEEKTIPDPLATKPDDWEEDMDGEWEPPLIDNPKCASVSGCGKWEPKKQKNPKYKGKWSAPEIDNPAYKGIWKPKRIPNPDYFEENDPYSKLDSLVAIGFELWTMTDDVSFDNILIAADKLEADQFATETYRIKNRIEAAGALSALQGMLDALQDRPWLWIIVIIVFAIPCAILIAWCCFAGGDTSDKTAYRKKKDETPLDDEGEGDEVEEEEDEDLEMPPLESQEQEGETEQSEVRKRQK